MFNCISQEGFHYTVNHFPFTYIYFSLQKHIAYRQIGRPTRNKIQLHKLTQAYINDLVTQRNSTE